MLTKFSWLRSCSLPSKIGKGSFTAKYNFAKYLIKSLACVQYYFTKTLANLWQIFNKKLIQQLIHYSTNTIPTDLAEWSNLGKTRIMHSHGSERSRWILSVLLNKGIALSNEGFQRWTIVLFETFNTLSISNSINIHYVMRYQDSYETFIRHISIHNQFSTHTLVIFESSQCRNSHTNLWDW